MPGLEALDGIDRKILEILQQDARTTHKELSTQLWLSITPIHARVKRLERQGYIRGYVALTDARMVDRPMTVFCMVSLKTHSREAVNAFIEGVQELPDLIECYHVTGEHDFMLKVMVRDMDAYQDFVVNRIGALVNVAQVQSTFVLTEVKHTTALPIPPPER